MTSTYSLLTGEIGLEIGPTMYLPTSNNSYLNIAALYSRKIFKQSYYNNTLTSTVSYVEIPVYFGNRFSWGKVDLYAQAGPYASYKFEAEMDSNAEMTIDDINDFDAGLAVLFGINIKRFKIEMGYKNGLINIFNKDAWKDYGVNSFDDVYIKMATPFLGVSYVF